MDAYLLSLITFIPVIGMAIVLLIKGDNLIKVVSAIFSGIPLALAIRMLRLYDPSTAEFQFVERHSWIPSFNIN
jgi:NADH-quinone oxidoreductase subunit M